MQASANYLKPLVILAVATRINTLPYRVGMVGAVVRSLLSDQKVPSSIGLLHPRKTAGTQITQS